MHDAEKRSFRRLFEHGRAKYAIVRHNSTMYEARQRNMVGALLDESSRGKHHEELLACLQYHSSRSALKQNEVRKKNACPPRARMNRTSSACTTHTCFASGGGALRVWLARRATSQKRRLHEELNILFRRATKPLRRQCFVAFVRNRTACRKQKAEKAVVIQCWWR